MEKILRQFSYLNDEQYGLICKLAFLYVDGLDFQENTDQKTKAFFNVNVKPKLDYMMKQRQRTRRNREEKKYEN